MVTLGEKAPLWGINRWAGAGLRFVPPDDEGFTLRGDKKHLLYKGHRRSHRFTILGDTAFEYDCILNREPESNVITFLIEGADHGSPVESFDFFKQPDSGQDPLLAGSYAVYKKEPLVGNGGMSEGTGKLCHILRPLIIDSRGRRCWGDLSVAGNNLSITIPASWLSEAKYPVTVDPVIGSSTAGAYHFFYYIYDGEYKECIQQWQKEGYSAAEIAENLEDWTVMPSAYNELFFNRWTSPETFQGLCKVFFHVAAMHSGDPHVFAPVFFNDSKNIPNTRISSEEYGYLGTKNKGPFGWNTVTFRVQNTVEAGSTLWLGLTTSGIGISFDYGAGYFDIAECINTVTAKKYITSGQHLGTLLTRLGEYIPYYLEAAANGDAELIEELRPSVYYQKHNAHPKRTGRYDFKFSYYFQPVGTVYRRTLITGVRLADSRKPAVTYRRAAVQGVWGKGVLNRSPVFIRRAVEQIQAAPGVSSREDLCRVMPDRAGVPSVLNRSGDSRRVMSHTVAPGTGLHRYVGIIKKLISTGGVRDQNGHLGGYIRGLYTAAGSMAETGHQGVYYRWQRDTVNGQGISFRHVLIFIRLLAGVYIRDYLIRRFLKSREELVIKSPVCREIILDSRL
jgi:hypothetical protein